MKVLVSACLLGMPCRYDGKSKAHPALLAKDWEWVPICPEVDGGLPTPRPRAEIQAGRVISEHGEDVSAAFFKGANIALEIAKAQGITHAVLKARSPSCGVGQIYDGSFSGRLVAGDGITAALLKVAGLEVITEEEIDGDLDCPFAHR